MFRTITNSLLDLLFPPRCCGCGADGTWLCATCVRSWRPIRIDRPTPHLDALVTLGSYDVPALASAVRALKFHGGRILAEQLGHRLARLIPDDTDCIIPVPLFPRRQRSRGFNQAALIAVALAVQRHLPYLEALIRTRPTEQQARLSERARSANVAGAFRLRRPLDFSGKRCTIVDDVFTTGATASAVAQVLRSAGAVRITAVAIAKG